MFNRGSLLLAATAALALLVANPGASQAQHGGGGHGGGGGGGHGGGGGFHGGGFHDGGFRGGFYGGYYGGYGLYGPLYLGGDYYGTNYGYGGSYYYDPSYIAPAFPEGPSNYPPAGAYIPPTIRPGDFDNIAPPPRPAGNTAAIQVYVPASADVWFDDLKTKQAGENRTFKSPALEPGKTYLYDIKARWTEDGKEVVRTKTVRVQAGLTAHVDFITQ